MKYLDLDFKLLEYHSDLIRPICKGLLLRKNQIKDKRPFKKNKFLNARNSKNKKGWYLIQI